MKLPVQNPASFIQSSTSHLVLGGRWTATGLGNVPSQVDLLDITRNTTVLANGSSIAAMDTAGAWVLHRMLLRLRHEGIGVRVDGLRPEIATLLALVASRLSDVPPKSVPTPVPAFVYVKVRATSALENLGHRGGALIAQAIAPLGFIGQCAMAALTAIREPARLRLQRILFNLRTAQAWVPMMPLAPGRCSTTNG